MVVAVGRPHDSEPIQSSSLSSTSSSSSSPSTISLKSDKKYILLNCHSMSLINVYYSLSSPTLAFGTTLIESKENNGVSYINLQMDYISQLISEGYCQQSVIRALGIAKNDLQMARDILHEFVSKSNLMN